MVNNSAAASSSIHMVVAYDRWVLKLIVVRSCLVLHTLTYLNSWTSNCLKSASHNRVSEWSLYWRDINRLLNCDTESGMAFGSEKLDRHSWHRGEHLMYSVLFIAAWSSRYQDISRYSACSSYAPEKELASSQYLGRRSTVGHFRTIHGEISPEIWWRLS